MSETKHSPEPWCDAEPEGWHGWITDGDGELLLGEGNYLEAADRRRIVACVNACAGIPTEALEAGELGDALDRATNAMSFIGGEGDEIDALDMDRLVRLCVALRRLGRLP